MRLRLQNRSSSAPPVTHALELPEEAVFSDIVSACYSFVAPQAAKYSGIDGYSGGKAKLDKALKSSSLQEISIFPTLMAGFPPSKLSFTPTTKVSDLLKSGESIDVRWVCTSEPPSNKRKKSGGTASSSSKKKKKGKGSSPPPSPPPSPAPASMSTSNAAASRRMAKMSGYTLSGETVPSSTPPPRAASRNQMSQRQISLGSSTTDVTESLLSSLSGGSSNKSKFLRKAMKGAVSKTYEVSKSVDRVSAVLFSIELNKKALHPSPPPPLPYPTDPAPPALTSLPDAKKKVKFAPSTSAMSTSGPGTFDISFFKPTGGTSAIVDSAVTILDLETLKGVVNLVMEGGDGDMLDVSTMSLVSLRVFWSLYYHFPFYHPHHVLQSWHPELASLDVRKRELSEKAKDNEAQERGDDDREEQAVDELLDLENKIVKGVEEGWKDRKKKAAEAAIARLGGTKETEWEWVVDTTEDDDELKECLGAGNEEWVEKLKDVGVHNWVMLAMADLGTSLGKEEAIVSALDVARLKTLEEIMMSIVDGKEDDYQSLLRARSATPFDLMNWDGEEEMLMEEIEGVEVGVVKEWVKRAKKVYGMDGCGWLGAYVC